MDRPDFSTRISPQMTMARWTVLVLLTGLLLSVGGCGGGKSSRGTLGSPAPAPTPTKGPSPTTTLALVSLDAGTRTYGYRFGKAPVGSATGDGVSVAITADIQGTVYYTV
ncbi:MAG: hypothetical protein OEW39_00670, partial [Deltaproteobacteria bacterium]|nr:hypothetical protein [Deltaproteobacteria bacterium]